MLPIVLVIAFFQLVVLKQAVPQLGQMLAGGLMVLIGLSLFEIITRPKLVMNGIIGQLLPWEILGVLSAVLLLMRKSLRELYTDTIQYQIGDSQAGCRMTV